MEKFVQSYLSKNYEIGTSEVGNDGIYSVEDKREVRAPIYGNKLVAEVITIFSIDDNESKELINKWAITKKPDINLEFYWATVEDIFKELFPIIQGLSARTVGVDLVPVQPMSDASGELLSFDFLYSGNNRTRNYEIADNDGPEIWDNIQQRFYGDLDHPNNI